jgi:hypothetical protein
MDLDFGDWKVAVDEFHFCQVAKVGELSVAGDRLVVVAIGLNNREFDLASSKLARIEANEQENVID